MNVPKGQWSLHGVLEARILKYRVSGAEAWINNKGFVICASIAGLDPGVGYHYGTPGRRSSGAIRRRLQAQLVLGHRRHASSAHVRGRQLEGFGHTRPRPRGHPHTRDPADRRGSGAAGADHGTWRRDAHDRARERLHRAHPLRRERQPRSDLDRAHPAPGRDVPRRAAARLAGGPAGFRRRASRDLEASGERASGQRRRTDRVHAPAAQRPERPLLRGSRRRAAARGHSARGPRDDPVPALTKRRRLAPRDRREIAQRRHRRPFTPSGASRSRSRRGPRRRHTSRSRAAETVSSSPGPEWRERPDTSSRSMAPMAARSSSGSPRRPTARQSPASRRRSEARCRCAQSGNSASPAAPPAPRSRRPERCRTDSSPTRSWASPRPKGARASFRRTPKSSERRRENADRLDSLHRLRSTVWPLAKRSRQRTRKGPS